MRSGDIESNLGPTTTRTNDLKSITVEWEDGRTSTINPRSTTATSVMLGDTISVKWGKKKKTYPGKVVGLEERPRSPRSAPTFPGNPPSNIKRDKHPTEGSARDQHPTAQPPSKVRHL